MKVNQVQHRIDVRYHPLDASALVMWILDQWHDHGDRKLFIGVPKHTGEAWVNRIRVRLSTTRSAMKRQGRPYVEFGFHDVVLPWRDELDGERFEMIILNRMVTNRHLIRTATKVIEL